MNNNNWLVEVFQAREKKQTAQTRTLTVDHRRHRRWTFYDSLGSIHLDFGFRLHRALDRPRQLACSRRPALFCSSDDIAPQPVRIRSSPIYGDRQRREKKTHTIVSMMIYWRELRVDCVIFAQLIECGTSMGRSSQYALREMYYFVAVHLLAVGLFTPIILRCVAVYDLLRVFMAFNAIIKWTWRSFSTSLYDAIN